MGGAGGGAGVFTGADTGVIATGLVAGNSIGPETAETVEGEKSTTVSGITFIGCGMAESIANGMAIRGAVGASCPDGNPAAWPATTDGGRDGETPSVGTVTIRAEVVGMGSEGGGGGANGLATAGASNRGADFTVPRARLGSIFWGGCAG